MTASVAVQTRPVSDPAPRDPRITRSRPADESRDEVLAGVSGIAFESLLSVTSRVAGATRGRGMEASAATQMFDAPSADAREQRGRAMESDYRSSFDQPAGDDRLDRSSVGARLARTSGSTDGSQPAPPRGSRSTNAAARANAAVASDLQTKDFNFDASSKINGTGDAPARSASSSASANRAGAALPAMDARSPTPESGAVASAVASAVTSKSGGIGSTPSSDPAQQIARILSGARGGAESARAVDAASTGQGGQSANSDSRTTNRSAHAGDAAGARSTESNTAGEKSSATQRTTPFDELVRSMRLNAGARHSSAKLQLDPPELGRLSVEIRMIAERAEVTVRTETPAARLIVRERAGELADALERRGIHLDRFEVTSGPPDPQTPAFAAGNGSEGAATGRGRAGTDTNGQPGERGMLPGDRGAPPGGAADGNGAVGNGVGVEPRLDIKI